MFHKRFKDDIFYPIPKYIDESAESPLSQCLKSGLPVFARDVDKTTGKLYVIYLFISFLFKRTSLTKM